MCKTGVVSGVGFRVEVFQLVSVFPSTLGSGPGGFHQIIPHGPGALWEYSGCGKAWPISGGFFPEIQDLVLGRDM